MEGTSARNPGDDVTSWQQNPTEPGPRVSRLHSGEEPAASSRALKMFCCLPLPRGRRPGRAQQQNVWHRARQWLRKPPRGLWPFSRRNGKVTREPQAGPCPLSHPTRGTLSPFPVCVDEGFSGYVCLEQAAADVGQKPVGWVAGCVHTPGESRLGGMGRVQAAPAAQEDPHVLGGWGGGTRAWEGGVSLVQGGYPSRRMFLPAAEVQAGRGSRHTGQAQLSQLQAGLADGQCHFRAGQWMWPMRGTPR